MFCIQWYLRWRLISRRKCNLGLSVVCWNQSVYTWMIKERLWDTHSNIYHIHISNILYHIHIYHMVLKFVKQFVSLKCILLCLWSRSIKVCIPPEEEAIASKACENTLLFVSLIVCLSKAPENETNRQVHTHVHYLIIGNREMFI